MVKVSVVVPVYNPGPYLKACVTSLTGQTLDPGEYEVIFVDDGSTDETPAYLEEVAAASPQVRVISQPNSGWPGQPRNVGIDAARGEYVFFCDHDDWLARDALARLHTFATECESDVVLPKMAGLGRPVPHHVFRQTVRRCSLADAPIMDSLTPHKLFRRAFLNENGIRFPEGKRRLEDHLFVVTAYLLAATVSIYADATCYFHIRRGDDANAGFRKIDWPGYFDNLSEAIDVVVAHTEPGELRDRILRRWLQVEMVNRLSGRRRVRMDEGEAAELLANAHRVAARYFGPGVVAQLPPLAQAVGQAVLDGDGDAVRRLAEGSAAWSVRAELLQVAWQDGRLQLSGTVRLTDEPLPPEPAPTPTSAPAPEVEADVEVEVEVESQAVEPPPEFRPADPLPERRFAALFAGLDPERLRDGLAAPLFGLDLTERRRGARWPVPVTAHRHGLLVSFTADVDLATLAAGRPLPKGLWDLHAQLGVLGLTDRRRVTLAPERPADALLVQPVDPGKTPRIVGYFTEKTAALCLDVGMIRHPELRKKVPLPVPPAPPAPKPPAAPKPKPTFRRRVARRLRRMVAG